MNNFRRFFLITSSLLLNLVFSKDVLSYQIEFYDEKIEDKFIVSPVKLDLKMKPGEIVEEEFLVVNRLGYKVDFKIEKEVFRGSDDLEKVTVFLGDQMKTGSSPVNWITPDIENFSLNHGERIKINLRIAIPQDAEGGGHYVAIFAKSAGEEIKSKDKVKLFTRAGMLTLITVDGQINRQGEIESFFSGKRLYKKGPVDFRVIFKNQGNVHLTTNGEISIENILGSTIATIPVNDWVILPSSRRENKVYWDKKWILGRYKATINLTSDDLDREFHQSYVFYAFPWHIALLILILLILVYLIFKKFLSGFEIRRINSDY